MELPSTMQQQKSHSSHLCHIRACRSQLRMVDTAAVVLPWCACGTWLPLERAQRKRDTALAASNDHAER